MLGTTSLYLTYVLPDASEAVFQLTHLAGSPAGSQELDISREARLHFFSVTLYL